MHTDCGNNKVPTFVCVNRHDSGVWIGLFVGNLLSFHRNEIQH
jgi:hypothetical protein